MEELCVKWRTILQSDFTLRRQFSKVSLCFRQKDSLQFRSRPIVNLFVGKISRVSCENRTKHTNMSNGKTQRFFMFQQIIGNAIVAAGSQTLNDHSMPITIYLFLFRKTEGQEI